MMNRIFSILLGLVTVSPGRAQGGGMKPMLGDLIVDHDPGLVGCWLMNEGGGNRVNDLSGNGNHGTITGATWVPGKFGPCLSFDGDGDYVNLGLAPNIGNGGSQLSVCAWIKVPTNTVPGFQVIIDKTSTGTDIFDFYIDSGEDIRFRLFNESGSNAAGIYDEGVLNVANQWVFISGVFNGTKITVYKNGVPDNPNAANWVGGNIRSDSHTLSIGAYNGGSGYYFNGSIDNVMIYKRALSASEIAQLCREPFCMFQQDRPDLYVAAGAPPAGGEWGQGQVLAALPAPP